MSSLSLFAAISGIILSIMDILNITVSHFLKMERLELIKTPKLYVDIYNCEPSNSSEKNSPSTQYCNSVQSVFLVSMRAVTLQGRKVLCSILNINSRSRYSVSAIFSVCSFGPEPSSYTASVDLRNKLVAVGNTLRAVSLVKEILFVTLSFLLRDALVVLYWVV